MQKHTICVLIGILVTITLSAQPSSSAAEKYFVAENFERALPLFEKLYQQEPSNISYVYRLGVCYLELFKDLDKAIAFLEEASAKSNEIGIKNNGYVWLDLGTAYRYAKNIEKAKECFEKFIQLARTADEKAEGEMMLKQLNNAKQLMENPLDITFVNMGKNINSPFNDYAPYVSANHQWMVFNSNRIFSKEIDRYLKNIHIVDFKKNVWRRANRAKTVNNPEDNLIAGKSASDDRLFIRAQRYFSSIVDDILYADIQKGNIAAKVNSLPEPINTIDIESGATLSPTGDTLIFTSNREGGAGQLDLYMSIKLPDNSWGTPKLLTQLNTPYNEDTPVLSQDGKTLWFASQGHNSMGGYDIFEAKWSATEKTWTKPRNLGYPINSFYDNYTIAYTRNTRYAYVSDVRSEGLGGYDIYQIIFNNEEPDVYLLFGTLFLGNKDNKQNIAEDFGMEISIHNKIDNTLVGEYSYDFKNNRFFAAVTSGEYILTVKTEKYELFQYEFEVQDRQIDESLDLGDLFLTPKAK